MYEWIESVLLSYLFYDEYKIQSEQRLQTGLQIGCSLWEVREFWSFSVFSATNNPLWRGANVAMWLNLVKDIGGSARCREGGGEGGAGRGCNGINEQRFFPPFNGCNVDWGPTSTSPHLTKKRENVEETKSADSWLDWVHMTRTMISR